MDTLQREVTNCFACGKPLDAIRDAPRHRPEPASEAERCPSRPQKYSGLQCMYAIGHECEHTARVPGTGLHYWLEADAR